MKTPKPYNSIRVFLDFIERLGATITDELWSLKDQDNETLNNLFVYADPVYYNFAICEKQELPVSMPNMPLKKFCTFSFDNYYEPESILNWNTLIQFAKLIVPEGRLAISDFSHAKDAYQRRLSAPYNEIEDHYSFRQVEANVDDTANRICQLRNQDENSEKIFQSVKKILLKERYFIDWKTDEELQGKPEFSRDETLIESKQILEPDEFQKTERAIYKLLNDFFREERNSIFARDGAYRCYERIHELLFGINWKRPER